MATIKDGKGTLCLAAFSPSLKLDKHEFGRPSPEGKGVLIDIKYCGMCHSDLHTCNGDWGLPGEKYPITPGHEIGGVVKEVGPDVTEFKVGDRVAVGCFVESCRECGECKKGLEQYCLKHLQTYSSAWPAEKGYKECVGTHTNGGYSDKICVDEHFVFKVPESIALEHAGPLLCAGITTFSPLNRHVLGKKDQTVAVVGFGGLGHMAVKFAVAMGAKVTVMSRSLAKKDAAAALGADIMAHTDEQAMKDAYRKFDTIIDTVSVSHPMRPIVSTLKVGGTCVMIGGIPEPFECSAFDMLFNGQSLEGSLVGGVPETRQMLEFCAEHNIRPDINIIDAKDASDHFAELQKGGPAIRNVIDMSTLANL